VRPRSHLVLRVASAWLADVGFGRGGLLDPIPFAPGGEYDQAGWRFRLISREGMHVLQARAAGGWEDQYAFVPEPVPFVDIEVNNWWTSTSPRSPFVTGLIAASVDDGGRRVTLNDRAGAPALIESTPAGEASEPVAWADVPRLLASRFGLTGFAVAPSGVRLAQAGAVGS
jgi:N-hydroxyarylamine O-acetyltransferase